jgi:hypothetical protein
MPAPECQRRDSMAFDFGLGDRNGCQKLKSRWLFKIDQVSATTNALPPLKGARPHIEFKEQQISHLVQHIYYPVMSEWKPITLTLYDNQAHNNPVFTWMQTLYDPSSTDNEWRPVFRPGAEEGNFKRTAKLCLYDGCGEVIETWTYENAYPQSINWGTLDMADSNFVTVDITLRYDRAYVQSGSPPLGRGFGIQDPNAVAGGLV